jgi:hypothetical protein
MKIINILFHRHLTIKHSFDLKKKEEKVLRKKRSITLFSLSCLEDVAATRASASKEPRVAVGRWKTTEIRRRRRRRKSSGGGGGAIFLREQKKRDDEKCILLLAVE